MEETITLTPVAVTDISKPDVSHIVTEDDTPVDNLFSEKQQRLLVESLYASWRGKFLAASNVGIFYGVYHPPIVPDFFLSMDVQVAENWYAKEHRSYFVWEFHKVPELVVEIVSNREGDELTRKLETYALIGIKYYVVMDPTQQLGDEILRAFYRNDYTYNPLPQAWFEELGLGAQLWQGEYEGVDALWLRWTDRDGNLLFTGAERAEQERARAEQERARADRLAEKLRALGVEPE